QHPLAPEPALIDGFHDGGLLRLEIGVAALHLADVDLRRGDEVAEVELVHLALGAEAELVSGPWRPRHLHARLGIDERLAALAVAGLADLGDLHPHARLDGEEGARPPGRLSERFAAKLLDLDRRGGQ